MNCYLNGTAVAAAAIERTSPTAPVSTRRAMPTIDVRTRNRTHHHHHHHLPGARISRLFTSGPDTRGAKNGNNNKQKTSMRVPQSRQPKSQSMSTSSSPSPVVTRISTELSSSTTSASCSLATKASSPHIGTAATVSVDAAVKSPNNVSSSSRNFGSVPVAAVAAPAPAAVPSGRTTPVAMKDEYGEMTSDGDTYTHPTPFELESGQVIPKAELRYQTYGELNEERDNVLVVCHALTGNASLHSWWGGLLGPGKAFDTSKYFVVCSNILGSCYGSTSPMSLKDEGNNGHDIYGLDFPDVSVQDTVRFQLTMLKDCLRISSIKCVIGGSFGGMQAVEYAVQAGDGTIPFVRSVVPIACGADHTAWQIAISEVQRQAIYADPEWIRGNYGEATTGLAVARQIGMISYRTPVGYVKKFGRDFQPPPASSAGVPNDLPPPVVATKTKYGQNAAWTVKSYLEYQGRKFLTRFDPVTYVKLTEQMDSHDIGRNRGGKENALKDVHIPALILGIDSDVLYPLYEQEELARLFPNGNLEIIHSDAGHDGFLLEQDQVSKKICDFLDSFP